MQLLQRGVGRGDHAAAAVGQPAQQALEHPRVVTVVDVQLVEHEQPDARQHLVDHAGVGAAGPVATAGRLLQPRRQVVGVGAQRRRVGGRAHRRVDQPGLAAAGRSPQQGAGPSATRHDQRGECRERPLLRRVEPAEHHRLRPHGVDTCSAVGTGAAPSGRVVRGVRPRAPAGTPSRRAPPSRTFTCRASASASCSPVACCGSGGRPRCSHSCRTSSVKRGSARGSSGIEPHSWHSATWSYAPYQAHSTGSSPRNAEQLGADLRPRHPGRRAAAAAAGRSRAPTGARRAGRSRRARRSSSRPSSATTPIDTSVTPGAVTPNSQS